MNITKHSIELHDSLKQIILDMALDKIYKLRPFTL